MSRRVVVIGLDCAAPQLVFERFRGAMPNLSRLMARGTWARLRSTVPPITVPAWASMTSGRDPGELGLYGFRNRSRGEYRTRLADGTQIRVPRLWDLLGASGRHSSVLFVPPSYPPSPVRGELVSCFLTPSSEHPHTHPPELQQELQERFGPYQMDVMEFRTSDKTGLLERIQAMSAQHFDMARYLWRTRRPDFLMMVDLSLDRFHHAFWQCFDPEHPAYDAGHPDRELGRRFYAFLDRELGELLAELDDDTTVLVVSDHGARAMHGGVAINEWLRDNGWLVLRRAPDAVTRLQDADVDWGATRAWGEGGYYARVFLNVRGREPHGRIDPEAYTRTRDELADALRAFPGPDGRALENEVVFPEDAYRAVQGLAPDLMVFFDGLRLRSVGSVGLGRIHTPVNDLGPDGCNHDWDGVFLMAGGGAPARGEDGVYAIYDVTRTVLGLLGVPAPADLLGVDRSLPS